MASKPMTSDRVRERQVVAKLYGEDQFVLDLCQSWLEQNEQISEQTELLKQLRSDLKWYQDKEK